MGIMDELKNASPEDLEALRSLFGKDKDAAPTEPEAEPPPAEYYVHLADGRVIETGDSASTHIDNVQVIGRYRMGD
jgi:hypothetical protein